MFLFLGFCTKTNSKDFCHSSCTDCFTLCPQVFPVYSFLCVGMLSTSFPSVRIDDCLFHLIFTAAAYSAYEVYFLSLKWLQFKPNAVIFNLTRSSRWLFWGKPIPFYLDYAWYSYNSVVSVTYKFFPFFLTDFLLCKQQCTISLLIIKFFLHEMRFLDKKHLSLRNEHISLQWEVYLCHSTQSCQDLSHRHMYLGLHGDKSMNSETSYILVPGTPKKKRSKE